MKIKVFHLKDDLSISCVNILFSGDVKIGPLYNLGRVKTLSGPRAAGGTG